MHIDLQYELATDQPFNPAADQEVFENALEQIALADKVGFHTVWFVEHHFLSEFSHSSAPEILFGAITQRTERIRIGVGVSLLPYLFNHPIRVAERVATLDILSGGRVEFGTGRSSEYEQMGFGISPQESRAQWQEALQIIPRMWTERPFKYKGRFFDIPERDIVPQPLQKPHPPMWLGCSSPEAWRLAALNGLGALGFSFLLTRDEFKAHLDAYRENIKDCVPAGKSVNDKVGGFTLAHCSTSKGAADVLGLNACAWYMLKSYELFLPRTAQGGWQALTDSSKQLMEALHSRSSEMYKVLNQQNSIVVGTPEECIKKLKIYEELGCERMLCLMQMRGVPHKDVMRSIELFGKEVIPAFKSKQRV